MRNTILYITFCLLCFNTSIYADEAQERSMYNQVQDLLDNYEENFLNKNKVKSLLNKMEKMNPNSHYMLVGYCRFSYKSGYISYNDYKQPALARARQYFRQAISIKPNFSDAYLYGAYAHAFSKKYDFAQKLANKARQLSPNSARVDILFAHLAKIHKDYAAIIQYAQAAISKEPNNNAILSKAYNNLSKAYKGLKDYAKADSIYKKIIELDPESAWARINYSSFLTKNLKNYDEAIEQGKIALELAEIGMAHKVLGKAYYEKAAQLHWDEKQYEASLLYFKHSTEQYAYDSNAWYGLGITYYQIGYKNRNKSQIKQAEAALKKALTIDPKHQEAIENLKHVEMLLNRLEKSS